MKEKYWIVLFSVLGAVVMVVLLRFDDVKRLLRRLNEGEDRKPLQSIVLEPGTIDDQQEKESKVLSLSEQRRSVTDRIPLDVNKIKEMRESGMTLQAIGDEMGVSASTVSNRLRELES